MVVLIRLADTQHHTRFTPNSIMKTCGRIDLRNENL